MLSIAQAALSETKEQLIRGCKFKPVSSETKIVALEFARELVVPSLCGGRQQANLRSKCAQSIRRIDVGAKSLRSKGLAALDLFLPLLFLYKL